MRHSRLYPVKFDHVDKAKIVALRRDHGLPYAAIATRFRCTADRIRQICLADGCRDRKNYEAPHLEPGAIGTTTLPEGVIAEMGLL